jgi:hypothetical protein
MFFSYFIYISGTMQPGANGLIMFSSSAVWKAAGANILVPRRLFIPALQ